MSSAGTATRTIAKPATATATSEAAKEEAEIDANTEELLKRLQALWSLPPLSFLYLVFLIDLLALSNSVM